MDIIVTDHSVENLERLYENKHILTNEHYSIMCEETKIPWLQLIPNRSLENTEYAGFLYQEAYKIATDLVSKGLPKHFNVAKIGNKLPFYHIHIVFRDERDEAWPKPIWCLKNLKNSRKTADNFKQLLEETFA